MTDAAPDALAHYAAERDGARLFLRGTAIVVDGRGVLIVGAPGRGKSGLSLFLMAHGARLVSDDGVWVAPTPSGPVVRRPDSAPPLIEARGIGLLNGGPICPDAPLHLIVDLDRGESARLPPRRIVTFGTAEIELILGAGLPEPGPALLLMLRHGRAIP